MALLTRWRMGRGRALHRRSPTGRAKATYVALLLVGVVALALGGAAVAGSFSPAAGPARAALNTPARTTTTTEPATRSAQPSGSAQPKGSVPSGSVGSTTTAPPASVVPTTTTAPPASVVPTPTTAPPASVVSTTTTAPPASVLPTPSSVLVEVLNGSGQEGAATAAARALARDGFLLNGTGNAGSFLHRVTLVVYPPGAEEAAEVVAGRVAGATKLEASTSLPGGVVDLVIGGTYAGIIAR